MINSSKFIRVVLGGTDFEECCKIDFSDEIMESCGIAELVNTNANYI